MKPKTKTEKRNPRCVQRGVRRIYEKDGLTLTLAAHYADQKTAVAVSKILEARETEGWTIDQAENFVMMAMQSVRSHKIFAGNNGRAIHKSIMACKHGDECA